MTKVTVIGANSPFGLHLVPALAASGLDVTAAVREMSRAAPEWSENSSITAIELDITAKVLPQINSEVVVWLAHIDAGRFNEFEVEQNLAAFSGVLERLRGTSTEKIVFISSGGSIYGHPEILPIPEGHPRKPLSSYGLAKRAMEDRLHEFAAETGIKTAILRPGNLYGFERPERNTKGVTAAFLRSLDNGEKFTLVQGGKTVRDFVHIDDACRAVLAAVNVPMSEVIWNVGTEKGTSILRIIELILCLRGRDMPQFDEIRNYGSDVFENILSIGRIRAEAGWNPTISIEEGIERTVLSWQRPKRNKMTR